MSGSSRIMLIIMFIASSTPGLSARAVDRVGVAIEPVGLSAEDLASFDGIHWHAFACTLTEVPELIGYDLITCAAGKVRVVPGLLDQTASARKLEHRFSVLYRESPDKSKLRVTVRLNDLSSNHEIDNPFVGLSVISLKSTTMDPKGSIALAIALAPGDTNINPEDQRPETAYRCLAIRIRTEKQSATMDFKARQRQLFYEIDHRAVYEACQDLMRSNREGKLSARAYHCDDPPEKLREVPAAIRAIEPTSIAINELMMSLIFVSDDGTQSLRCMSNEFGEPPASAGAGGLGFRSDPYAMDRLTGAESLETLNERYSHFHMSLYPGLQYEYYGEESPATVAGAKETAEGLAGLTGLIHKMATNLAIKKQRLLYRVDHQKLLEACREVIQRYEEGVFTSAQIHLVPDEFADEMKDTVEYQQTQENVEHIPQIILGLEPGYLWFLDHSVMVAIAGGLDHAGVIAYADGVAAELDDDQMKLIDGLVYYDDGLREAGEDYPAYLQSLKDEVMLYVDWVRKQKNLPLPQRNPLD